ncbi:MAG: hypothetical protein NZM37_11795, partial [Sandaracinaceae bacterium]|nr:hypothetical protein [Sandaracinaceae bacterium]
MPILARLLDLRSAPILLAMRSFEGMKGVFGRLHAWFWSEVFCLMFFLIGCGKGDSAQVVIAVQVCGIEEMDRQQLQIKYQVREGGEDGMRAGSHEGAFLHHPWHIALAPKGGDVNRRYWVKIELFRDGNKWASAVLTGGYEAGRVVTRHIALRMGDDCSCSDDGCGICMVATKAGGRVEVDRRLCEMDGGMMMDAPIFVLEAGGPDGGLDG